MDDRPLICLVMTTLNDQTALRDTLASVRPHVDRYAIVDLGSTDGSPEAVRQALEGLEGELVEAKPADFGAAKNQALDLASGRAVFALVVEAGEVLANGEALRRFAEANRGATGAHHGAYLIGVQQGGARSDHPRLVRAGAGFRYLGAAHEQLVRDKAPPPSQRVPEALLNFDPSRRGPAAQRERWELEVRHLQEDLRKRPKDGHAAFALGLTYENLGDQRRAYTTFERRTKMGGRQDEVYESFMRMARLTKAANRPWAEAQQLALSAHSHSPHRAEPLFFLAWHYYERKNWPLTFLFASRGASLPLPERPSLFVEPDVYEAKLDDLVGTSAFYIGEFAAGEASLRRALGRRPGDARLLKNLAFYESRGRKGAGQGQGQNQGQGQGQGQGQNQGQGQGGRRQGQRQNAEGGAASAETAGPAGGLHSPAEGEASAAGAGPEQAAPSAGNGPSGYEGGTSESASSAANSPAEGAPTPGPTGSSEGGSSGQGESRSAGPTGEGASRSESGPTGEGESRPAGGPTGEGASRSENGPTGEGEARPEGGPTGEGESRPDGGPTG